MPLIGKIEYLISTNNDELYNFFIDDKQRLNFLYSKNRKWLSQETISSFSVISFDIEIDSSDTLHLIAVGSDNTIKYFNIYNCQVNKSIVLQDKNSDNNILYPKILLRDSFIDFFFYQQTGISSCQLKHILFQEDIKTTEVVADSSFNKYINNYKIFKTKDMVHLLYMDLENNVEEIFYKSFSSEDNQWSPGQQLTTSGIRKLYLNGLIDNENSLHFVWSNYTEDNLTIYHGKGNLSDLKPKEVKLNQLSQPLNSSFPYPLLYNNRLMVIWYQYNNLVLSTSLDMGDSWGNEITISESKGKPFKRYRYKSTKINEVGLVGDTLYGTTYPQIQFLGLGGDNNDEVPSQS